MLKVLWSVTYFAFEWPTQEVHKHVYSISKAKACALTIDPMNVPTQHSTYIYIYIYIYGKCYFTSNGHFYVHYFKIMRLSIYILVYTDISNMLLKN